MSPPRRAALLWGSALVILLLVMHWGCPPLRDALWRRSFPVKEESGRFIVYATEDPELAGSLAAALDRFERAFWIHPAPRLGLSAPEGKIHIFCYETKRDLDKEVRRKWQRDFSNNAAYYDPETWRIALAKKDVEGEFDREEFLHTAYHECVHMLMERGRQGALSLWLSEGLACCFEGGVPDKAGGIRARVDPLFLLMALDLLAKGEILPLEDVLHAGGEAFSSEGNAIYYVESALLTYYLLEERPEVFDACLAGELEGRARDPVRLLEEASGESIEDLEAQFHAFLMEYAQKTSK